MTYQSETPAHKTQAALAAGRLAAMTEYQPRRDISQTRYALSGECEISGADQAGESGDMIPAQRLAQVGD